VKTTMDLTNELTSIFSTRTEFSATAGVTWKVSGKPGPADSSGRRSGPPARTGPAGQVNYTSDGNTGSQPKLTEPRGHLLASGRPLLQQNECPNENRPIMTPTSAYTIFVLLSGRAIEKDPPILSESPSGCCIGSVIAQ
jgi:hypothetical protein